MKKTLSIIVPVYNTGEYLHRCIKSVLEQTLSDIEIILVDDGSLDKSGEICDEYAKKDERVKVIHKENEGASVARNVGISISCGEYVGFVDSDDWIEKNMYENMIKKAKETDAEIVMCDAVTKYDNKPDEPDTITQIKESCVLEKVDISPGLLLELSGSVWRCIYKLQFINDNKLKFQPHIAFSEDRIFNIQALGYTSKCAYIKEAYYNRYINKDSIVHKFHPDYFESIKEVHKYTNKALSDAWGNDEKYIQEYSQHFIGGTYAAINN